MLIDDILQYFQENFNQYLIYVYQHLGLSIQAIGISCLIGIPLGYISHKHRKLSQMITFSSQALRIIPSLAVLFLLISFIGVGRAPALIALVLLGIPPILVNTTVGFLEVPAVMIETGKGLGMTDRELLKRVKIPTGFSFCDDRCEARVGGNHLECDVGYIHRCWRFGNIDFYRIGFEQDGSASHWRGIGSDDCLHDKHLS